MNTTAHDFVTVDMRGLKAALVARAQAERVSVSVLVRGAVARELGLSAEGESLQVASRSGAAASAASVKLSIRMRPDEARQLAAGARAAGLSRGAFLAGLVANVPVLLAGGGRAEHITSLMASGAELSTLSRNIYRLTELLRQANVEPARPTVRSWTRWLATYASTSNSPPECWLTCSRAAAAPPLRADPTGDFH